MSLVKLYTTLCPLQQDFCRSQPFCVITQTTFYTSCHPYLPILDTSLQVLQTKYRFVVVRNSLVYEFDIVETVYHLAILHMQSNKIHNFCFG